MTSAPKNPGGNRRIAKFQQNLNGVNIVDFENDPVKVKLFGMLARLTDEQMAQLEEYLKNLIEIKED